MQNKHANKISHTQTVNIHLNTHNVLGNPIHTQIKEINHEVCREEERRQ